MVKSKRHNNTSFPIKGPAYQDPSKIYYRELAAEGVRAKKDWQNFDPRGNVYLIGNKSLGWYKIGLTRDCEAPDKRFKTIQNGVPFELDVLRYWFVPFARSFEKLLHYEFSGKVVRGEWFCFPETELEGVIAKIKEWADKVPNMPNQQDTAQMLNVGADD